MPELLIAHASSHGHTAKIATRISHRLQSQGIGVREVDLLKDGSCSPASSDGIIVVASIHRGKYHRDVIAWAKRWREWFAQHPSALASVSLTAAESTAESETVTRRWPDELATSTGWKPDLTMSFAGALQYREYNFLTRTLMRLLMRKGGHPTDTSQDYEYTDWVAVDRFADDFRELALAELDTTHPVKR